MSDFAGAKLLLVDPARRALVYQRDAFAHLPWPGHWDLPGGGREGQESPEACVLRELHEEFGLTLPQDRLLWAAEFPGLLNPETRGWFFAGRLHQAEIAAIRFGPEGQRWDLWPLNQWLTHPHAIPALQDRSRQALTALGW